MNKQNQLPHTDHSQSSQNYRPRSPDLSGFSAPPPPRLSRLPSLPHQPDPDLPSGYQFGPRGSYDASPYFSPSNSQPPSYFVSQPHQSPYPVTQSSGYYSQSPFSQPQSQPLDDMARLRSRPQVNYNESAHREDEFDERIASSARMPPQPQSIMQVQVSAPMQQQPYPGQQQMFTTMQVPPIPAAQQSSPLPQVDVRTKFPVARIKRIMQADEDIGKVAQATPTAVAKALECFMIALVTKGASDAKQSNSKRVTATHLKNALLNDPQYDFLKEICENAPDESAKKSRAKGDAKSEESEDEDIGGPAKKRKGGKKKKDDSD